jgi:LuxR family transcriptional regulator, quorum-sensing system regulator BjaR1
MPSSDYPKIAFDFIDDLDRLSDIIKFTQHFSTAIGRFGYTSFLITGVPEPPPLQPYILANGWPTGWTEHYAKADYYRHDPVAAWCRRTVQPFEWSEAPLDLERSPRAAEVMNCARDFGLKQGFSCANRAQHGLPGMCFDGGRQSRLRTSHQASAASYEHVCARTLRRD